MSKSIYGAFAVLALASMSGLLQPAGAQEKAKPASTLKVKLHYSGAGTVDDKHNIIVFLFDSPGFTQGSGAMPIASQVATSKDATVTFPDVSTSPVYVSAVYDPTGNYDGQSGPPPSGSSLGLYSKEPGKPAPVTAEPGKTAEIDLPFDDTAKMP